jgi:hypothetical protein
LRPSHSTSCVPTPYNPKPTLRSTVIAPVNDQRIGQRSTHRSTFNVQRSTHLMLLRLAIHRPLVSSSETIPKPHPRHRSTVNVRSTVNGQHPVNGQRTWCFCGSRSTVHIASLSDIIPKPRPSGLSVFLSCLVWWWWWSTCRVVGLIFEINQGVRPGKKKKTENHNRNRGMSGQNRPSRNSNSTILPADDWLSV